MRLRDLANTFRVLTLRNISHPLGLIGMMVMYLSGIPIVVLLLLEGLGLIDSPYLGIFTFLVLPAFFAFGVLLVVLGRFRARRRAEKTGDQPLHPFPHWDLNRPEDRARFLVMVAGGSLLLIIVAALSYQGVEYTESVGFCGTTCHTVMQPEHTAYMNSPHARVSCVECHIGPGAGWYVRSKLSGLRQVWAVATDSYARPIATPIHNLRPARETCEQCHWPEKFHGDKVIVKRHYAEDEANSEIVNALVLKVGGGGTESGFAEGIHWHVNLEVDYVADEKREEILWVRARQPDGQVTEYVKDGAELPVDFLAAGEIRRMDCLDCHNRPTHTFEDAAVALDEAIASGRIDAGLPFVKREALAAITAEYASREEAASQIPARLSAFYAEQIPDSVAVDAAAVTAAAAAAEIYARNVFPQMKVTWGTYPNHIGHERSQGCFRCHDEEHTSAEGATISQDCETCHTLLAWEERDPAILHELFP
jgi:nitrate/TMAO reductase-like tetraheme cytochrome c subunit